MKQDIGTYIDRRLREIRNDRNPAAATLGRAAGLAVRALGRVACAARRLCHGPSRDERGRCIAAGRRACSDCREVDIPAMQRLTDRSN